MGRTGVHQWVKRLNDQRDQQLAHRALADRFELCPAHPVQDGKHKWRRLTFRSPWREKCLYCKVERDIVE